MIKSDTLQGSVKVPAFEKSVLLSGRENMNRSVDGDIVAVEILPKSEWKAPDDEVVDEEGKVVYRESTPLLTNFFQLQIRMMMLNRMTMKRASWTWRVCSSRPNGSTLSKVSGSTSTLRSARIWQGGAAGRRYFLLMAGRRTTHRGAGTAIRLS